MEAKQDEGAVALQLLSKLEQKDNEINKFIKWGKMIIFVLVGVMVLILVIFAWREIYNSHRLVAQLQETTYVKDGLNFQGLGKAERREIYMKMMIRIFNAYGYRYDPNNHPPQGMSKEQKLRYIDFNLEIAPLMDFGLYDIPCINLLESSFNPNCKHQYGEVGIGGIKWMTAKLAEGMVNSLPVPLKSKLYFKLNNANDLKDVITSLKITYTLLYFLKKEFNGSEMWYVGMYHWGGFLYKRYRQYVSYRDAVSKGKVVEVENDDFPTKFVINGVVYHPAQYYFAWRSLKDAFERGDIEAGKKVVDKYRKEQDNIMREEVDLQTSQKIIKKLRKELENKKIIEKSLKEQLTDIDKLLVETDIKLRDVYNIAREGGASNFKKNFKKSRDVIVDFLEKFEFKQKKTFTQKLANMNIKSFMLLFFAVSILIGIVIWQVIKYLYRKKFKHIIDKLKIKR